LPEKGLPPIAVETMDALIRFLDGLDASSPEHAGLLEFISRNLPPWLRETLGPEDILQDCAVLLLEKPHLVPSRGDLLPWIRALALNMIHNKARSGRGKKRRPPGRALRLDLPEEGGPRTIARGWISKIPSPEKVVERSNLFRKVLEEILDLPRIQADLIILRHYRGLRLRMAARALGLEPTDASRLLDRGLQRIRRRIRAGIRHRPGTRDPPSRDGEGS